MKLFLGAALILNLVLCACEVYVLRKVKTKRNILKYYTFLQNFLAFIVSGLFSAFLFASVFFDCAIPEYMRGLRYAATCGLTATTLIYVFFLSSNSKNLLSDEDFTHLDPQRANWLLHYVCPGISLLSFVVFERQIPLTAPQWTGYASIPSCLYWTTYFILSAAKLWEEPYDFTSPKGGWKGRLSEFLPVLLLPLVFILVSFVLWNVK